MEKIPVEIFIAEQLRDPRYKSIIAQLAVDPVAVELALVRYLRDQGIHLVSSGLAEQIAAHMADELEHRRGMGSVFKNILQKNG